MIITATRCRDAVTDGVIAIFGMYFACPEIFFVPTFDRKAEKGFCFFTDKCKRKCCGVGFPNDSVDRIQ
jgi:hypothetical protein